MENHILFLSLHHHLFHVQHSAYSGVVVIVVYMYVQDMCALNMFAPHAKLKSKKSD